MARRMSAQETIDRATGNIQGSVWVLRQAGLSYDQIMAIVKAANDEWDPSDQPAFIVNDPQADS